MIVNEMKISAGKYKGRNFYRPAGIRPTQGILRAAVFDILGHDLEGLSFLELYAGSGAMSLEAISRGACRVVMVEHDRKNAQVIRQNCELLRIHLGGPYRLLEADALAAIKRLSADGQRFNIVFLDPPYGLKLVKKTLKVIRGNDILHPQSFMVMQCDRRDLPDVPEGFSLITQRRYGASYLIVFQKNE